MTEAAEPSTSNLREQLRALWRRRSLVLIVFAIVAVVALSPAYFLQSRYQAAGTILIEQQEIPQDFVRSTITSFATQRIQMITQRVMTTANLLGIIDRYGLYPELRRRGTREALLERMRADVSMRMISADVIDPRSGSPTKATIAFAVGYESPSADLAYKVASELITLYLNENASSRAKQTEQASAFLAEESDRLSRQIVELDNRLAEFKQKQGKRLPEFAQLNLSGIERSESDIREIRNRLGTLEQERMILEAQLAQLSPVSPMLSDSGARVLTPEERLKTLKSTLAGLEARYAPNHPDIVATRREIAGLEAQLSRTGAADPNELRRRLDDARSRLAVARERYAPDHPDVKSLERASATLEQSLAATEKAPPPPAARPDNPAYLQVRGQLDSLLAERDALRQKEEDAQSRLRDYEGRFTQEPDVERRYRSLVRDYDNAQAKYRDVRAKQMEAQVSQNLETERKGERFTLIDPPLLPQEPVSPNRRLIVLIGLLLSGLAGVGAAVVREATDGTVRGHSDLRKLLEVPALA